MGEWIIVLDSCNQISRSNKRDYDICNNMNESLKDYVKQKKPYMKEYAHIHMKV